MCISQTVNDSSVVLKIALDKVDTKGNSSFKKELSSDEDNSEFWSTLPELQTVQTDTEYLEKAKTLITQLNSDFQPQDIAIIEYMVCKSPKKGQSSQYASGGLG